MTDHLNITADINRMKDAMEEMKRLLQRIEGIKSHLQEISDREADGGTPLFNVRMQPRGAGWDSGFSIIPSRGKDVPDEVREFVAAYRKLLLSQVSSLYDEIQKLKEEI